MKWYVTRPEKHIIAVSLFPVLENSARVAMTFDDFIGQHAKLIQLRSVIDFGEKGNSVFVLACKFLLVKGCNVTIQVRDLLNLVKVSFKYE